MKILTSCLLSVIFASAACSEQIKGIFYYTETYICTGSCIVYPPTPAASPAFYIFDTDTQQAKIFNFVESEILFDYDKRTFNVSRRDGIEPILTKEELTDLFVAEWKLYVEYTDEYDIDVVGECSFREDGSWTFATQYLFGPHGFYGDIIYFDDFTPPALESKSMELSVSTDNARAYLSMEAPLGLKCKLYRSENLSEWDEVELDPTYVNLTEHGDIVSSGIYASIHTEYLASADSAFYKIEFSLLEHTD